MIAKRIPLITPENPQYNLPQEIMMQITIPKEIEAIIRSRAKVSGFEKVEDYVLSILIADSAPQPAAQMPYEQWHREFFSQVENFQPGNPNFDDSRESIYPVR